MEKNFVCGMLIGLVGGALIVANSYKARKLVKEGQEQLKSKVAEMSKKRGNESENYDELSE